MKWLKNIFAWLTGETQARRTVEEFVERFPGRCMICSLHRYGYTHGHEKEPQPKPHVCIEELV